MCGVCRDHPEQNNKEVAGMQQASCDTWWAIMDHSKSSFMDPTYKIYIKPAKHFGKKIWFWSFYLDFFSTCWTKDDLKGIVHLYYKWMLCADIWLHRRGKGHLCGSGSIICVCWQSCRQVWNYFYILIACIIPFIIACILQTLDCVNVF